MEEIVLLRKFIELKKIIPLIDSDIEYYKNKEQEKFIKKKQQAENELASVRIKLEEFPNTVESQHAKQKIIDQLYDYIHEMEKAKSGLKLLRNEHTINENMLFDNIESDVYQAISNKTTRIIPHLIYTDDDKESVEIKDVHNFLISEINILKSLEETNYVKLYDYFINFKNRIKNTFK
jgi:hypothetical protein